MLHHHDAVRDLGHNAKIMGDEHHAGVVPGLKFGDQPQDLRLRRHVERCRRLVRNQEARVEDQGHRDHRALPLAAGQLVRKRGDDALRLGQLDLGKQGEDPLAPLGPAHLRGVDDQHLLDLAAHGHQRVEGRHRLLEDHGELFAPQHATLLARQGQQIVPAEQDRSGRGVHPRLGQQPHHRACGQGFARSALADDADDLAIRHCRRQVFDRVHPVRAGGQGDVQTADIQQGRGHASRSRRRGFSASLRPSPTRLIARTVSMIAIPGKVQIHHAWRSTDRPAPT